MNNAETKTTHQPLSAEEIRLAKALITQRQAHIERQIASLKQVTEILYDCRNLNERKAELLDCRKKLSDDMQEFIARTIRQDMQEATAITVAFSITQTTLK